MTIILSLKDIRIINGSMQVFIDHSREILKTKRNQTGVDQDEFVIMKRDFPIVFDPYVCAVKLQTKLFESDGK